MRFMTHMRCVSVSSGYWDTGYFDPHQIYSSWPWDMTSSPRTSVYLRDLQFCKPISYVDVGKDEFSWFHQGPEIAYGDNAVAHVKSSTVAVPSGYCSYTGRENQVRYVVGTDKSNYKVRMVRVLPVESFSLNFPNPGEHCFLYFSVYITPSGEYGSFSQSSWLYGVNFDTGAVRRAQLHPLFTYNTNGFTVSDARKSAGAMLDRMCDLSQWYCDLWSNPYPRAAFDIKTPLPGEVVDPAGVCFQRALRLWESFDDIDQKYVALGDIAVRTADQAGRMLSNNDALILETVQLLKDIAGLLRGKTSLIQRVRHFVANLPRDFKGRAKLLANLRLSEQYGLKLTIQDFADLKDFVARQIHARALLTTRSAGSWASKTPDGTVYTEEHWKCWISKERAYAPAIARLFRDDLIGFQNVWDLIPYSFVVDWFAPVGEILQAWDDELMLSNMAIDAIVVGRKSVCTTRTESGKWTYITSTSRYTRERRSSFPPYAYTTQSITPNLRVVLNGAALIVQRL